MASLAKTSLSNQSFLPKLWKVSKIVLRSQGIKSAKHSSAPSLAYPTTSHRDSLDFVLKVFGFWNLQVGTAQERNGELPDGVGNSSHVQEAG
jgi:hypothetical protein